MKKIADTLSSPGGANVFTSDNDPEFIADALPFTIKMYESVLTSLPWHYALRLRTGSLYVMYANAFLQAPADMLPEEQYLEKEFQLGRARNLYLRGRDILLQAIAGKYPGFSADLKKEKLNSLVASMSKEDVPVLYWAAAGWVAAYAIDPFDMKLGLTLPKAEILMNRVLELDPEFGNGSIHDFYILYYGSLPDYMGGDLNRAREHFKRSVLLSKGKSAAPYLALATTVCVKQQNLKEFRSLLKTAMKVDPDKDPENRLVHIINRRKAVWLNSHYEDFFICPEEETSEKNSIPGDLP